MWKKPQQLAFLLLFAVLVFAVPSRATPGYQVVGVQTERTGPLLVTEWTVQDGSDPASRFTIHRVHKPNAHTRGVLLLMPGGGSSFDLYTADEDGQLQQSFAGFFATRGFDVWGYSPRTRGLAP